MTLTSNLLNTYNFISLKLSKNPAFTYKKVRKKNKSLLQYWFYGISIKIVAANQQKWGFVNQAQNFNAGLVKQTL